MAIDFLIAIVTAILLLLEWFRRSRVARIILALGASVFILMHRDLGPSARWALATKDRVTVRWDRQLPEYVSGVLTMKREAEFYISDLTWPVLLLAWLGVSPMLPAIGRRPSADLPALNHEDEPWT